MSPATFIRALRPYQWTKNLLVFAPLLFSGGLSDSSQVTLAALAAVAFVLASSATYLINDVLDAERDRAHTEKRNRPVASGALSPTFAIAGAVVFVSAALGIGYYVRPALAGTLAIYLAVTLAYSLALKNVVILDVIIVAIGFDIRAIGGAVAINVIFTNWLVMCTFFLALFLAISKRRHECAVATEDAHATRDVLRHYSVEFLDRLNLIVAGAALMTYTIYTCAPEVIARMGTDKLYATTPFVLYGIARYLYLVQADRTHGDPSAAFLRDVPLMVTVAGWIAACAVIIYS